MQNHVSIFPESVPTAEKGYLPYGTFLFFLASNQLIRYMVLILSMLSPKHFFLKIMLTLGYEPVSKVR